MRTVPKHFAAGALIVLAGASGACALVTWYVRCSSVWRGSDGDASDQIGALVATGAVLVAFIALIVVALGVALVVLQRGVVQARADGRLGGRFAGTAANGYFTICGRASDGTWRAYSPDMPDVGVAGCASREEAERALAFAIERHADGRVVES